MTKTDTRSLPAWWYVNTFDYREILKRDHTHLIAMEKDGQLINEDVQLRSEDQTAVAITLNGREFLLVPTQWVTPRTEHIESFWLTKELDFTDPEISDIYQIIESGSIWEKGAESAAVKLFGQTGSKIAHRDITTIVPIGNGKYIATDGNHCSVISRREQSQTAIKINMQRIAVSQ